MDVAPACGTGAAFANAVTVTCNDGAAKTGRNGPGLATDVENFGTWSEDDARHRGVAGELAHRKGIEDESVGGLVEGTGITFEPWNVDMDSEMDSFPAHNRVMDSVEEAAGEVAQSVGASL
jgi:hypothetical protein